MREPVFSWVDIDLLDPNPWNPNSMDDEMFAKAIESIHRFGFVDPVTVREQGYERYQIIDGEHRWAAAKLHSGSCTKTDHVGLHQLPITNLGIIEDSIAKQLTIVLNETRGEYKPREMGELLVSLLAAEPLPTLLEVLPFTPERFQELAELPAINWDDLSPKRPAQSGRSEKWVERVYRLPVEAAAKIDEAIREARGDHDTPDWRSLQTIAESFLGS
jgi:hypothetical protein